MTIHNLPDHKNNKPYFQKIMITTDLQQQRSQLHVSLLQ